MSYPLKTSEHISVSLIQIGCIQRGCFSLELSVQSLHLRALEDAYRVSQFMSQNFSVTLLRVEPGEGDRTIGVAHIFPDMGCLMVPRLR